MNFGTFYFDSYDTSSYVYNSTSSLWLIVWAPVGAKNIQVNEAIFLFGCQSHSWVLLLSKDDNESLFCLMMAAAWAGLVLHWTNDTTQTRLNSLLRSCAGQEEASLRLDKNRTVIVGVLCSPTMTVRILYSVQITAAFGDALLLYMQTHLWHLRPGW